MDIYLKLMWHKLITITIFLHEWKSDADPFRSTIDSRYIAIQYDTILQQAQFQRLNYGQTSNSQKTPICRSRWLAMGVFRELSTTIYRHGTVYIFLSNTGHYYLYRKVSIIRRTKFQNLCDSPPALQLSLPNLLKPCIKSRTCIKSRMKM